MTGFEDMIHAAFAESSQDLSRVTRNTAATGPVVMRELSTTYRPDRPQLSTALSCGRPAALHRSVISLQPQGWHHYAPPNINTWYSDWFSMDSKTHSIDALEYLANHERKDLLRFLTAGSVDDGKSTLIGRLLHDSGNIYDEGQRLNATLRASVTPVRDDDYAPCSTAPAEREQGITIDVAYRYFTQRRVHYRRHTGHEQYTRNGNRRLDR